MHDTSSSGITTSLSDESFGESKTSISDAYGSWGLFKRSPWDLWIILFAKFIESFSFISEDLVFMMLMKEDFQIS